MTKLNREKFTHKGTEYVVVLGNKGNVIAVEKNVPVRNAMQPHTRKTRLRGTRLSEVWNAFELSKVTP